MLKRLAIQNYAIIDRVDIEFAASLNIITGETGAGKSILMGALSLILGDRADTSVLLNRDKKCVVEGYFSARNKEVKSFLRSNDLDEGEDDLMIRREISAAGKSRAFVNDIPVNLEQLRDLSSLLVDLHRQFDTRELGESDFQRQVLDALAGQADLLQSYQTLYSQWQHSRREWQELQSQKADFEKEYDYNRFLFEELDSAAFRENELEEAEAELKLLNSAESVKSVLHAACYQLEEADQPLVQQLKSMSQQLLPYADHHPALGSLVDRLQSAQVELQDIADELNRVGNHVQYDPKKAEQLDERLSLGYRLLKKHGLQHTHELLSLRNSLEGKLQAILNLDEALASKEKVVKQLEKEALEAARSIRANRQACIPAFETAVNKLLLQVGMPNARFKAECQPLDQLQAHGMDRVEFLFDANRSNRFEPIRRVASGGELSRLMLCIKSLVAESLDLPTLIFDEIDTGISGEAARQVGLIMKTLAASRQVISITHQPQIAGKADAHFFVYKQRQGESLQTGIRLLDKEERIQAIAKMLGGEKPTAAALENAREMLMN